MNEPADILKTGSKISTSERTTVKLHQKAVNDSGSVPEMYKFAKYFTKSGIISGSDDQRGLGLHGKATVEYAPC